MKSSLTPRLPGLILLMILSSALSSCGLFKKDAEPAVVPIPKKSTRDITSFSFDNTSGDVVKIDTARGLVLVRALWRPKGWQLQPSIGFNGVTISPVPAVQDYSKPQKFTVTAENGMSKQYTVIVSSAWANYVDVKSAPDATIHTHDGSYHKVLEATEETVAPGNKVLTIFQGGSNAQFTNTGEFFFANTLKVPLISNTYLRTHTFTNRRKYPNSFPEATCYFMLSRGSSTYWKLTPESGMIQITAYDKIYNMVSGNFKEIKYANTFSNNNYPHELTRGEFINVLIQ